MQAHPVGIAPVSCKALRDVGRVSGQELRLKPFALRVKSTPFKLWVTLLWLLNPLPGAHLTRSRTRNADGFYRKFALDFFRAQLGISQLETSVMQFVLLRKLQRHDGGVPECESVCAQKIHIYPVVDTLWVFRVNQQMVCPERATFPLICNFPAKLYDGIAPLVAR